MMNFSVCKLKIKILNMGKKLKTKCGKQRSKETIKETVVVIQGVHGLDLGRNSDLEKNA